MSNEPVSETKSVTYEVSPIGSRLKNAREALRLTSLDIARQLRLRLECIESLEQDDYANMPGATFAKGYLRAYARLVNLPPDELIADFERLKLMPNSNGLIIPEQKSSMSIKEKPLRLLILVGLGLFIFMVIVWNVFFDKDTSASAVANPPIQNSALSGQPAAVQSTPYTADPALKAQSPTDTATATTAAPADKTATNTALSSQQAAPTPHANAPAAKPVETAEASAAETEAKPASDDSNASGDSEKAVKKANSKAAKAHANLAEPFE